MWQYGWKILLDDLPLKRDEYAKDNGHAIIFDSISLIVYGTGMLLIAIIL